MRIRRLAQLIAVPATLVMAVPVTVVLLPETATAKPASSAVNGGPARSPRSRQVPTRSAGRQSVQKPSLITVERSTSSPTTTSSTHNASNRVPTAVTKSANSSVAKAAKPTPIPTTKLPTATTPPHNPAKPQTGATVSKAKSRTTRGRSRNAKLHVLANQVEAAAAAPTPTRVPVIQGPIVPVYQVAVTPNPTPDSKEQGTVPLLVNGQPYRADSQRRTNQTIPLAKVTVPTAKPSNVIALPDSTAPDATIAPLPRKRRTPQSVAAAGTTPSTNPSSSNAVTSNQKRSAADPTTRSNGDPDGTQVAPVFLPNDSTRWSIANAAPATTTPSRVDFTATPVSATVVVSPNSARSVRAGASVSPTHPRAGDVVAWALAQIGTPYRWAGTGAESGGFDCSGLSMKAWEQVGVVLPHQSGMQFNATSRIDFDELEPGDLVFFGSPIHHLGVYIGDGKMVEAPRSGSVVRISSATRRDYVGAGRVIFS